MQIKYLITIVLLIINHAIYSQKNYPFTEEYWDFENADVTQENYQGKEAVQILRTISLKDVELSNGIIEVDINFSNDRNFPGILFRGQASSIEDFYIRPHQSGNPDANQYTPVFNGDAGWQFYYGENFSKPIEYTYDVWHQLKIELAGLQAKIYFDDMINPILEIPELKTGQLSGLLALKGGRVPTWFSNFRITRTDKSTLGIPMPKEDIPTGRIQQWEISQLLADSLFENLEEIQDDLVEIIDWQTVPVEESGVLNLSRYRARSAGHNTAIARWKIDAAGSEIRKINFGFSDFVTIYFNGRILYSGRDNFRSRDYRFLGTVGYFDSVYLPLEKGENEVWFVLKENFGGWGIKAMVEN